MLGTALTQLDQIAANVIADGAMLDNLNAQLQDCQRQNPPPPPTPEPVPGGTGTGTGAGPGGECTVDGAPASNSVCFTQELDAALAIWTACTQAYFAAEAEAFRTGGDLPINTCDPAFRAAQDAIQQHWGTSP